MKSTKQWTDLALYEIAYQGENDDEPHTKQDLITICNGMEDTARALYELLDWQSPSTLLEEWRMEGEVDHDFNLNTPLSIVDRIIKRKKNGIDCTEKESAEIKGWLRETLIMVGSGEVQMVADIQSLFPMEYGEWLDETGESITPVAIQLQIVESINSCEGRIENGADVNQAFGWFREEVQRIFNGEIINDTSLTK